MNETPASTAFEDPMDSALRKLDELSRLSPTSMVAPLLTPTEALVLLASREHWIETLRHFYEHGYDRKTCEEALAHAPQPREPRVDLAARLQAMGIVRYTERTPEEAAQAVEELAHVAIGLDMQTWSRISSDILGCIARCARLEQPGETAGQRYIINAQEDAHGFPKLAVIPSPNGEWIRASETTPGEQPSTSVERQYSAHPAVNADLKRRLED